MTQTPALRLTLAEGGEQQRVAGVNICLFPIYAKVPTPSGEKFFEGKAHSDGCHGTLGSYAKVVFNQVGNIRHLCRRAGTSGEGD